MAHETSTTKSGPARAQEITDANAEFVAFIETCTEEEWSRVSAAESWPVNAVADHIAWGHEISAGWIRTIRAGENVPGSPEAHDAANNARAAQATTTSRAEVIQLANRNVSQLAELLRSLTEIDLSKSATFGPGGGNTMSLDQLAGSRRHLDRHLGGIRSTVGR